MQLTTLIDRAYDGLRDANREFITPEEVTSWLNEAQRDLAHRQRVYQKEISGTVEAGGTIPLPADLIDIQTIRIGDSSLRATNSDHWFGIADTFAADPYGGPFFRVFAGKVEAYPAPATGVAYKMRYVAEPPDLVLNTDQPLLPLELQHRMVHYARSHGFMRLNEQTQAENYMQLYENGLEPPPLGTSRINPGPTAFRYEPGPFDLDPGARHRG